MTAVTHIFDIAKEILNEVVALYAAEGLALPARRAVTEGEFAWDCESVLFRLARTFPGTPNAPDLDPCVSARTAEYHLSIIRCASSPDEEGVPPKPTIIESFSLPILTDAWFLPRALRMSPLFTPCDEFYVGELVVVGPEGGFGGVDLTIHRLLG